VVTIDPMDVPTPVAATDHQKSAWQSMTEAKQESEKQSKK
jgi:hypothetical protein